MTIQKWTLIDAEHKTSVDPWSVSSADVGGQAGDFTVSMRRLQGGLSEGVATIHIRSGSFAVEVVPSRGMGIWKAWLGDEEIGWQSPVRGPVHPQFVALAEPSGLGWLDGFDELLVRCGLESNGAPEFDSQGRLKYPLHGRIANRPAHRVELSIDDQSGAITLQGEVEEARFHFLKFRLRSTLVLRRGEAGFRLRDEIVNWSRSPAEAQLLYHINFGPPLLDAGSRLVAPARKVVPRNARAAEGISRWDSFAAEQPGFVEQVYFLELAGDADHQSRVLLKNAHGTRGVSLQFNTQQLPCFTLWKNTTAIADGYVTGLEPGTNFPNPRSFEGERGRVVKLAPGGSATFDLQFSAHGSAREVEQAEQAVRELQGNTVATVHERPLPEWCAP